jgi:hypothetical protein
MSTPPRASHFPLSFPSPVSGSQTTTNSVHYERMLECLKAIRSCDNPTKRFEIYDVHFKAMSALNETAEMQTELLPLIPAFFEKLLADLDNSDLDPVLLCNHVTSNICTLLHIPTYSSLVNIKLALEVLTRALHSQHKQFVVCVVWIVSLIDASLTPAGLAAALRQLISMLLDVTKRFSESSQAIQREALHALANLNLLAPDAMRAFCPAWARFCLPFFFDHEARMRGLAFKLARSADPTICFTDPEFGLTICHYLHHEGLDVLENARMLRKILGHTEVCAPATSTNFASTVPTTTSRVSDRETALFTLDCLDIYIRLAGCAILAWRAPNPKPTPIFSTSLLDPLPNSLLGGAKEVKEKGYKLANRFLGRVRLLFIHADETVRVRTFSGPWSSLVHNLALSSEGLDGKRVSKPPTTGPSRVHGNVGFGGSKLTEVSILTLLTKPILKVCEDQKQSVCVRLSAAQVWVSLLEILSTQGSLLALESTFEACVGAALPCLVAPLQDSAVVTTVLTALANALSQHNDSLSHSQAGKTTNTCKQNMASGSMSVLRLLLTSLKHRWVPRTSSRAANPAQYPPTPANLSAQHAGSFFPPAPAELAAAGMLARAALEFAWLLETGKPQGCVRVRV